MDASDGRHPDADRQLVVAAYPALIGGTLYVDTGGRQDLKLPGFRKEGLRVGNEAEATLALGLYMAFVIVGALATVPALIEVA